MKRVEGLRSGLRPHALWTLLGIVSVACLWYAYTLPGGVGMFVCSGMAFVMWHYLGSRGSWMAVIVIGLGMSGVLGWQAVTAARCPAEGTKVFLKENKPPVGCDEVRASAAVMSTFFALIAGLGIGAPIYARRLEDEDDEDALDDAATPVA